MTSGVPFKIRDLLRETAAIQRFFSDLICSLVLFHKKINKINKILLFMSNKYGLNSLSVTQLSLPCKNYFTPKTVLKLFSVNTFITVCAHVLSP